MPKRGRPKGPDKEPVLLRLGGPLLDIRKALDKLGEETDIDLDPERKASMVSNLLVVLVSDKDATPVINTGTLYA